MNKAWRRHPALAGQFHPHFPDHLQVIAHDGGPRTSAARPEAVWVEVHALEHGIGRGRVLVSPFHLQTVHHGAEIFFVAASGCAHPVMVTPKYLAERRSWLIHPCPTCGLAELFDPPSELIERTFPDLPAGQTMAGFTTLCPLCLRKGTMGAEHVDHAREMAEQEAAVTTAQRPRWWQLWR